MRWTTALGVTAATLFAGYAARNYRRYFDFTGKTVVITGGSRGLGLELARQFRQKGASIVLLARDPVELNRATNMLQAKGASIFPIPCDVTQRSEVEEAMRQVLSEYGHIDVLVNNAGLIQTGPLDNMTPDDFDSAMGVHFRGPLNTMLTVIPTMRRQGGGRIVNIVSISGKIAVPHLAPYSASKFALAGLSDAVRSELRRDRIFVTTVFPGLMRTGSIYQAGFKGNPEAEFRWFAASASTPLLSMNSTRAARKIVQACRYGQSELVIGLPAKGMTLFHHLFPAISAEILALAARLLPSASPSTPNQIQLGRDIQPTPLPKWVTHLSDQAAQRNNEGVVMVS